MKKLLFLFIGIIFLLANIKAQTKPGFETMVDKYKVLDLADIKVTYRLLSMQDTVKKNVEEDIQVLLLGKNVSKYYSQKYLEYNINSTKLILKGADAIPGFREDGAFGYEIFKNMKDSEMEVTDLGACIGGIIFIKKQHQILTGRLEMSIVKYCLTLARKPPDILEEGLMRFGLRQIFQLTMGHGN